MDARPKVLFLLFEGLAATVVESQVLANVRMMQQAQVAKFEIWAFACLGGLMGDSRARRAAAERFAQAPVRLFRGVRPLSPLAYFLNVLLLAWHLRAKRRRFTHIHARTDYSAAVAVPVARLFGIPLIWDCRGDAVAEVEERFSGCGGGLALLAQLRARELRAYTRLAGRFCSAALFVTDDLQELHRGLVAGKPTEIVPCAANEELFFYDSDLRATTRRRLGFGAAETVYIYSGSFAAYQCFEDTVALFAVVHRGDPSSRLLVLTPALETARQMLIGLPEESFRVHACTLEEVNGYLNAADVGLMLRRPSRTNRVASPTKFAEYGLAGLAVLIGDAVPYATRMARVAGNLARIEDGVLIAPRTPRPAIAACYRKLLGRGRFIDNYRCLYARAADRRRG